MSITLRALARRRARALGVALMLGPRPTRNAGARVEDAIVTVWLPVGLHLVNVVRRTCTALVERVKINGATTCTHGGRWQRASTNMHSGKSVSLWASNGVHGSLQSHKFEAE